MQASDPAFTDSTVASPASIYNYYAQGDCDRGMTPTEVFTVLQTHGALSLSEFPYYDSDCTRLPGPQQRQSAQRMRISGYQRLQNQLDDIRGRIAQGDPVFISINTPESLMEDFGASVFRLPPRPVFLGGHALIAMGYDDDREAIRIMNSWGNRWADGGYAWIDYGSFRQMLNSAWVVSAEPVVNPPLPPPPPIVAEAISTLRDYVSDIDCADIEVSFQDETVIVRGFVGAPEDLAEIETFVSGLDDEVEARLEIDLRPWPQCEALLTLAPALRAGAALDLRVSGQDSAHVDLNGGDELVFEVTSPDFRAYLYLAYVQADGETVWLVQPQSVLSPAANPHTVVRVGDGTPPWGKFRIAEPFGTELAIAIASASPLFEEPREQVELDRDFLSALRLAVNRQARMAGELLVSADIVAITTQE